MVQSEQSGGKVLYLVNRGNITNTLDPSHIHYSLNNISEEGIEASETAMHLGQLAHFQGMINKVSVFYFNQS